jgi:CBS domain-containing protein
MWEERSGSVLVIDGKQQLRGIFTGRDVVRLLAKGKDAHCPLVKAMTRNPVTITANSRAVDALRSMADGGFRHVPVTEEGTIKGVVSRGDLKGMELEEFLWQDGMPPRGTGRTFRSLSEMIEGHKPLVLGEEQTVRPACRCMRRRKCGCTLHRHRQFPGGTSWSGPSSRGGRGFLLAGRGHRGRRVNRAWTEGPLASRGCGNSFNGCIHTHDGQKPLPCNRFGPRYCPAKPSSRHG